MAQDLSEYTAALLALRHTLYTYARCAVLQLDENCQRYAFPAQSIANNWTRFSLSPSGLRNTKRCSKQRALHKKQSPTGNLGHKLVTGKCVDLLLPDTTEYHNNIDRLVDSGSKTPSLGQRLAVAQQVALSDVIPKRCTSHIEEQSTHLYCLKPTSPFDSTGLC